MAKQVYEGHFLGMRKKFLEFKEPDLQVEFQNTVYPCHSFILALFSDVTSEMFASDPDQSRWSKGVAAAWEGSTPEAVQVYLKLTYSNVYSKFHAFLPMEGVLETMELAHKLDNEVVKKICAELVVANIGNYLKTPRLLLQVAQQCDMPSLQATCVTEILMDIVTQSRSQHGMWKNAMSSKFKDLLNYELDPLVKYQLNSAITELFTSAVVGSSGKALPGLERNQIEEIMKG